MSKVIGKDSLGNDLYEGDKVLVDGEFEETIEYGEYREKFDFGSVFGYFIPDNCVKLEKEIEKL